MQQQQQSPFAHVCSEQISNIYYVMLSFSPPHLPNPVNDPLPPLRRSPNRRPPSSANRKEPLLLKEAKPIIRGAKNFCCFFC